MLHAQNASSGFALRITVLISRSRTLPSEAPLDITPNVEETCFNTAEYQIGIMDRNKFLGFLIILLMLTCGCVGTTPAEQKISDDDLYLQSLEDYIVALSMTQSQQSNSQFTAQQIGAAELKIRSSTYINRVTPLKVSSKFDSSKTSFLQSLKDQEALGDFLLAHSSEEQGRFAVNPSSMTAAQKQEYANAAQHNQNYALFLIKAFDTNVCSAAMGKYTNITGVCGANQAHLK